VSDSWGSQAGFARISVMMQAFSIHLVARAVFTEFPAVQGALWLCLQDFWVRHRVTLGCICGIPGSDAW
jgi:hypothetical protein